MRMCVCTWREGEAVIKLVSGIRWAAQRMNYAISAPRSSNDHGKYFPVCGAG